MTREEAIHFAVCLKNNWTINFADMEEFCDMAIEALSEPRGDLISRQDALKPFCTAPDGTRIPEVDCDNFPVEFSVEFIKKHLLSLPSATCDDCIWHVCNYNKVDWDKPSAETETVDCTEFIRWLTETVMDDGMWELNAVAYGEVIARKLTKLGVLEVKDDVYVYEPSAEPKTDEENELKFYYVESIDDYWVGRRLDNFYYANWHKGLGFVWSHSRYLPWEEHIVDENTLWKEHTYPSEPIEIPFTEWVVGFVKKYFTEPKTGEWIEVEVLPEVYDIEGVKTWGSKMQCDQCGFRFTAVEGHIRQYNYCPNCGAKMFREDGEA